MRIEKIVRENAVYYDSYMELKPNSRKYDQICGGRCMPAITDVSCNSCGQRHKLFLPAFDFFEPMRLYQYFCPITGNRSELSAVGDWRKAQLSRRPTGSVEVGQVDS